MLEGAFIVKVTEEELPEVGTLPAPVQPVQTYCVPAGPANGEVTEAVMFTPESNHPLVGVGESRAEDTVRKY
jgi:hypothetical protein